MDRAATAEPPCAAHECLLADMPAGVSIQAKGVTWQGDRGVIRELIAEHLPPAGDTDPGRAATVIKSGPHRAVYRVAIPSGIYFLKHFRVPDWRALVRNWLNRSPAEREAAAAARVAAAGIDTTVPAAVGVTRRSRLVRDSFLVTREIPEARPLDQVLRERLSADQIAPPAGAARFRRELARALGRLAGRLHRHGLTHGDLHPANILADILADGSIRLSLIDLQRVRRRRRLQFVRSRRDLFGLYNSFNALAGRSERRRFLDAYWIEATASDSRPRTFGFHQRSDALGRIVRRLEAHCVRALRRVQIQNDRKWQRPHRRLIVADGAGQQARGLSRLGQAAVLKFRDNPDSLFQSGTIRFWRRRARNDRAAVVDLVIAQRTITCDVREVSRPLGWRDLISIPPCSEMRRAWEMGHALARRRIAAVRPLLYIRSRTASCVREYLVTEPADNMLTLAVFLAHRLSSLPLPEREVWIDRVSRRLAAQLARMHQFSLVHGQLSAANILVGVERNECNVQIAGVQHVVRKRRFTPHDVAVEMARLQASLAAIREITPAHRLRFLRAACAGTRWTEVKRIWRSIKTELTTSTELRLLPFRRRTFEAGQDRGRGGSFAKTAVFLTAMAALFLTAGCQAVDRPIALPVRFSVPGDQLLVLSDFKLQKDHELIRELNGLREQVTNILDLPVKRDPIVVYLFNNETEYRRYMNATYPRLPPRSAYFIGTATELAVFTHWGHNVREDLRHEYTHGLLHAGLKRVPVWLDEGLAEYFEVAGPKPGGLNHDYAQHLTEAVASGWRPDMKRLENLDDSAQMKRAEYQESWAWVHFLLNSTPEAKAALVSYLAQLRTNPHPETISHRLRTVLPEYDSRFVSYLSQLHPVTQTAGAL